MANNLRSFQIIDIIVGSDLLIASGLASILSEVIAKFHVEIRGRAICETIDRYTQIVLSLQTCQSTFSSMLETKGNSDFLT